MQSEAGASYGLFVWLWSGDLHRMCGLFGIGIRGASCGPLAWAYECVLGLCIGIFQVVLFVVVILLLVDI